MKCTEVEKQINFYIDGEISTLHKKEIESHLANCYDCREAVGNLQELRKVLTGYLPVKDSAPNSAEIMEVFNRHHSKKQNKFAGWLSAVFGQKIGYKTAIASLSLMLLAFTSFGFLIGRLTATELRVEMPAIEIAPNMPPQTSEQQLAVQDAEKIEKREQPTVKYVEVPVEKEKIITRTIYLNRPEKQTKVSRSVKNQPDNQAAETAINQKEYLTQADLGKFQPVSELKPKITKKEDYEK